MKAVFLIVSAVILLITSSFAQDILLRSGDQIELRLGGVPADEISQVSGSYQVDGQGFVNMPHIGRVQAAGLTQGQLQAAIEQSYKEKQIYTNPTITVSVPSTARFVNVGGAVRTPRRVEFTPDLTLLGAINAAGGFTEFADQAKVRLLRGGEASVINVKDIRRDPSKDVKLKPGDTIEVPQSWW